MTRCFECLDEFHNGDQRYAVLKQMRELPPDWIGTARARAEYEALCYDQVYICQDCAGWHGDEAIPADIVTDSRLDVRGVQ
jgi:hypothetical protein